MDQIKKMSDIKNSDLVLEYADCFIVKKSTIPNAGVGVFALKKFKKGQILGEYRGKSFSQQCELPLPPPKHDDWMYAYCDDKNNTIFGNNEMSRINDIVDFRQLTPEETMMMDREKKIPLIRKEYNVEFVENKGIIHIVAEKDLEINDELFIDYGYEYWLRLFQEFGFLSNYNHLLKKRKCNGSKSNKRKCNLKKMKLQHGRILIKLKINNESIIKKFISRGYKIV